MITESLSFESANPFEVSKLRPQNFVVKTETIKNARLITMNANARFFRSWSPFLWDPIHEAKRTANSMILIISLMLSGIGENSVMQTISITKNAGRNLKIIPVFILSFFSGV